jgi:hypothetical protein
VTENRLLSVSTSSFCVIIGLFLSVLPVNSWQDPSITSKVFFDIEIDGAPAGIVRFRDAKSSILRGSMYDCSYFAFLRPHRVRLVWQDCPQDCRELQGFVHRWVHVGSVLSMYTHIAVLSWLCGLGFCVCVGFAQPVSLSGAAHAVPGTDACVAAAQQSFLLISQVSSLFGLYTAYYFV